MYSFDTNTRGHVRNRAKCRKCNSIIESFTVSDYVPCECGEIAIDGGSFKFLLYAKNWENFIRISDNDEEIEIKVSEIEHKDDEGDRVRHLKFLIEKYELLPTQALQAPATNYDVLSILKLVDSLLS